MAAVRTTRRTRPASVHVLVSLLLLLAINALYGGSSLILDPSGDRLGIPVGLLEGSPFPDYLLPGLILFWVLGILPLLVALALWLEPAWRAMGGLERLLREHWARSAAVVVGIALIVWIGVQMTVLRFFLQPVLLGLGLAITAVGLLPSVRRHYARPTAGRGGEGSPR